MDRDFEKRKLLFEARTKAYGQLIGKIKNRFVPDLLGENKDTRTKQYEFNNILSESYLLSSEKLHITLQEYSSTMGDIYQLVIEQEKSGVETTIEDNERFDLLILSIDKKVTKLLSSCEKIYI